MKEIIKSLDEIKLLLQLNKSMLNAEELCLLLGISKTYLYHLTSSGKIRYYRPFGKIMYFDKAEILESLKQNTIKSNSDIKDDALNYFTNSKKK